MLYTPFFEYGGGKMKEPLLAYCPYLRFNFEYVHNVYECRQLVFCNSKLSFFKFDIQVGWTNTIILSFTNVLYT